MGCSRVALSAILVGLICAADVAGAGVDVVAPQNRLGFTVADSTRLSRRISVTNQEKRLLDLRMDFEDPTAGGAIIVTFDPEVVELTDVVFDEGSLGDDADFRCPATSGAAHSIACPEDAAFLSFGSVSGIGGERRIATLEFTALASGSTPVGFTVAKTFSDMSGKPLLVPEPAGQGALALVALALIQRRRWRSAVRS